MPDSSNAGPGSNASAVGAAPWTIADTQPVGCCVCGVPGRSLYRVPPFGVVRCPVCQVVFVSPRLTSAALQRLYDEPAYFEGASLEGSAFRGGVYGSQSSWSPAMMLQRTWTSGRIAEIGRRCPPPARLLEIGSGYGLFLAAAKRAGYDVRGVELSRTGADHSSRRLGFDVFCGQLADAPTAEADVVCFWDTLEHVPDPVLFLIEVRRRLAPGGVFALSIPYFSSLPSRLLRARWWTLKPEQHIWHLTPATLRLIAARAGLVITTITTSPLRRANAGRTDSLVAVGRSIPSVGPQAGAGQ